MYYSLFCDDSNVHNLRTKEFFEIGVTVYHTLYDTKATTFDTCFSLSFHHSEIGMKNKRLNESVYFIENIEFKKKVGQGQNAMQRM